MLVQQGEEDVLDADVVILHGLGLAGGSAQHFVRCLRDIDLVRVTARAGHPGHCGKLFRHGSREAACVHIQLLQKLRDQALLLRSQGVQQMLRLQCVMLILHSQLLGCLQSFQCLLGIFMDFNKAALEMHETHHGKVGIVSKVEVKTRDDLSTAYTPGVAEPCRKIRENPDDVYKYTFKGNMVAVVSNGTAVLGLGDIGPEAGLPVMEGKAVLFKEFGGVDAFPICIDAHDAASVIAACKAIAPTFGGINLEDIKSPECFEIEETLERELDIPVFHDDQHGTAIVVTAALINALRVVGKEDGGRPHRPERPRRCRYGHHQDADDRRRKDIIAVDQFGTLYKGCNSAEAHKNWLGEVTNPRQIKGGLKEAIEGADVFIGVSRPGILTTELCKTMNKDAIVFAMANPTPEIMPDEAKAGGVRVMATGRSDFPNQVNNVLCFPGLFKGALSVRARDINDKMKLAAAYAIADLITDDDRSEENIIPGAFDPRVAEAVAAAVAKAARETGVARL